MRVWVEKAGKGGKARGRDPLKKAYGPLPSCGDPFYAVERAVDPLALKRPLPAAWRSLQWLRDCSR